MSTQLDIDVPRGGDYFREWQLTDDVGVPIDITGHTLTAQAKTQPGGTLVATATIVKVEPTAGKYTIKWHGPDFSAVAGTTEIARVPWDLKHVAAGVTEYPAYGNINLLPTVT